MAVIVIPIVLGLLVGFIWLMVLAARKSNQGQANVGETRGEFIGLAQSLGATTANGVSFSAVHAGRPYDFNLSVPGKNSPLVLTITGNIDLSAPGRGGAVAQVQGGYRGDPRATVKEAFEVLFRKENGRDRFGKSIKLNREFHAGDPIFDATVYVESDARDEALKLYLQNEAVRTAIISLLEIGFERVELFRGAACVRLSRTNPTKGQITAFQDVAQAIEVLVDSLPHFEGNPVGRATPLRAAVILSYSIVSAIAFLIAGPVCDGLYHTVHSGALTSCILAGLSLWVFSTVIVFVLLRGKSDSLRNVGTWFLSQAIALPAVCVALALTFNAKLDDSTPVRHVATVKRTWVTHNKNSTSYHVEVVSWRPDQTAITLDVSSSVFASANSTRRLEVTTGTGYLGWEWVISKR
jgi:hypothetical protein